MKTINSRTIRSVAAATLLWVVLVYGGLLGGADRGSLLALISLSFLFLVVLLLILFRQHQTIVNKENENIQMMDDVVNGHPAGIYRLVQQKRSPLFSNRLPEIHYTFLNDQHEHITGLSRQQMIANPLHIQTIIHPDDRDDFFIANNEAVAGRLPFRWEGRIIGKGKQEKWLRIESNPKELDNGDILWTGIMLDITAQKAMEQDLARRELLERLVTELSSDFVNIHIDNFDMLIHAALKRMGQFCQADRSYVFKLDPENNIAINTHEWCNEGIDPQIMNLKKLDIPNISQWISTLQSFKPVNVYDINQLPESWYSVKEILKAQDVKSLLVVPVISQERLVGFVGFDSVKNYRTWKEYEIKLLHVFADLIYNALERQKAENALRTSEKKYRILTENAFDGIYLLANHRFDYVNPRFCEITGYRADELLSDAFDIWSLFTQQSRQFIEERRKARRENKEIPGLYEVQIVSKTGQILDVEVSTNPLSVADNIVILGIMRDITERKQNEALRTQVEIANQTVRFKQNFLANMSHEIRTPLTGVMGMIEILSSTSLDDLQHDYLNTLRLSTENLREIINQILDYSKIEAGQVNLKNRVFNTRIFFENTRKLYGSICRKDIDFQIHVHKDLPECLMADENRLQQVVNNLISNAVKFTHQGSITLEVKSGKTKDPDTLRVRVIVTDTGIGIKPDALYKLFYPFQEVETDDKRHFDGTGLGLSICKELVKLMGGTIHVNSQPGKGSKFWFTILARVASEADIKCSRTSGRDQTIQMPDSVLRILFAEDKVINQKVVELMLSAMGHKIKVVNNGLEAIEAYKPGEYDLILMDIQMPTMDGITATRVLREKFSALPPVVGLSANAFEGDREKYIAMGLDEYLTKPVTSADFENLIQKFFKQK